MGLRVLGSGLMEVLGAEGVGLRILCVDPR